MKTITEKDAMGYMLQQLALVLLAESPIKDAVRAAAQSHRGKLFANITPEQRAVLTKLRDTVLELTRKLANCQDIETLNMTYNYLVSLNAGEVLVAIEDGEGVVTGYTKNS